MTKSPDIFVRGGTATTAWTNELKRRALDAEERRRVESQRRELAAKPQKNGVVRRHTMQLGGRNSHASIVLGIKHPKDTTILDWMVCELSFQGDARSQSSVSSIVTAPENPEFLLVMVCPACLSRGVHPQWAQMTVQSKHKRLLFEPGRVPKWMSGEGNFNKNNNIWVNPKDPNEVITVAGSVTVDERCRCDAEGCSYSFKIDDSILYGEYR